MQQTTHMAKDDYSNRELDTKFASIMELLTDIKTQTTKTNGRVNKLERNMLIVGVAVIVIVFLKFPEFKGLLMLII